MGRTYRTMQGRVVDMDELRSKNELMPAVGNYRVNARGDEIGKGGQVVRTREQIMSEYYADNPNATPDPNAKPTQQPDKEVKPSIPPSETLKIKDTPANEVVEEVEEPVVEAKKTPSMENETLAKVEETAVSKAVEAANRARRRRSGIKDATGE